jgi:FkbM family methyltransferase
MTGQALDEGVGWYAQFGEDRILDAMMPHHDGLFVEVGAADGVDGSNTLHFEKLGWTGVLVEANPYFAQQCRSSRSSMIAECAVSSPNHPRIVPFTIVTGAHQQLSGLKPKVETLRRHGIERVETVLVSCRTLDEVLSEMIPGRIPDFVTIDVEGHEWSVLQGFTLDVWRPSIVIVERQYHPDWRILRHMHRHGYAYTRTTGVNDWFERAVPQSGLELARVAAPLYWNGVRPLATAGLARIGLLPTVKRLIGRTGPSIR